MTDQRNRTLGLGRGQLRLRRPRRRFRCRRAAAAASVASALSEGTEAPAVRSSSCRECRPAPWRTMVPDRRPTRTSLVIATLRTSVGTVRSNVMAGSDSAGPGFGANSWLVEEMYEQYRADPDSVGESWREFFEDYRSMTAAAHPTAGRVADTRAAAGTGALPWHRPPSRLRRRSPRPRPLPSPASRASRSRASAP